MRGSCGASGSGPATPSSSARSSASTWAAGARRRGRSRSVPVVPYGAGVPGQTERAVEYLRRCGRASSTGRPPTRSTSRRSPASAEADPAWFGFRIMFFSGEPGAGIPATKRRIEETFGAAAIDTGSMAEMAPVDDERRVRRARGDAPLGRHRLHGARRSRDGGAGRGDGEGVPVYTHLERTSQPMIRLFSGDLAPRDQRALPLRADLPPAAGGVYGRVDDMLIVRGINVYPHAIEEAIGRVPGVGSEYRIVVERPDELDLLCSRWRPTKVVPRPPFARASGSRSGSRAVVQIHPAGACPPRSSSRGASSTAARSPS